MTIKTAVIGNPISHSKSPKLHEFLIKKYNLTAKYEAIQIKPENLEQEIHNLLFEKNYSGLNITIPYKENIFELFKNKNYTLTKSAKITGSVNTIYKENGHLVGSSSDGFGFIKNIEFFKGKDFLDKDNKSALVIGAGGAAKAIVFALSQNKFSKIKIYNRTIKKAEVLKEKFKNYCDISIIENLNARQFENCDLITNTTSMGMNGSKNLQIDISRARQSTLFCDIVYNPLMTNFLQNAQNKNHPIVTGIGMLIFQAIEGFEKWHNIKIDISKQDFQFLSNILTK